jgi:hypothetical protein
VAELAESSGTARVHDASEGAKKTMEDVYSRFFQACEVLFPLELKSVIAGMSVWAHAACRRSAGHWSSDVSSTGLILDT